jgi:hypothetical protein
MGDTEGRAPLISSTIRFASFLHFSTFYSLLLPSRSAETLPCGRQAARHDPGQTLPHREPLPTVEATIIAYNLRVSWEKQETPGAVRRERYHGVRAGLWRRINT